MAVIVAILILANYSKLRGESFLTPRHLASAISLLVIINTSTIGANVFKLPPPPELSIGTTTGNGVLLEISKLRMQKQQGGAFDKHFMGEQNVYQVVHVKVTNHSSVMYFPNLHDFEMLASDAMNYPSWPIFNSNKLFTDRTVPPGHSAETDLAFPMPRDKKPAAVTWSGPDLVGINRPLAPMMGERTILIPDANGHPVSSLTPGGPIGTVSQFGVTVKFDKPQIVDLQGPDRQRVPPGYVIETVRVTVHNLLPKKLEIRESEFVLLDSRGLASSYPLRNPKLTLGMYFINSGQTLETYLKFIAPVGNPPAAIRWQPAPLWLGKIAPRKMIVMLAK